MGKQAASAVVYLGVNLKHSVCRTCFKSYPRKDGFNSKHCSVECKAMATPKQKCHGNHEWKLVMCTFKNNTQHQKQVCVKCKKAAYIPKSAKAPIDIEKKPPGQSKLDKAIVASAEKSSVILKDKYGDGFYVSRKWLVVRYKTLIKHGHMCQLCGSIEKPMHVDHIKPRSLYPNLEVDENNLQVLCKLCNLGKGNSDETDFRNRR